MASIHETYTTVNEVNEALYNYAFKTELNDFATTQYIKDAYSLYTHLNKNYINDTQLSGYILGTDIPAAIVLSNYVVKTDYNTLAEKEIVLKNENAVLKS